ncbi:unnamed protein product [Ceutorhynchus assimilis]|uniref:Peptidase metallopeptidase domain-containing protein n=1 Tax=Ceutorhynchus assimilis TaxID=467358 RepID=A0A9P0DK51_9CUCU|nr:unnamed protein product [Ceutorhynchus assimilis]
MDSKKVGCVCRFRGCFVIVLLLLFMVIGRFRGCDCSRNDSRILKREALDGHLQEYLMNFGYMKRSSDGAFAMRTEESIRQSISEMQAFAGIPVTGKLDEKTVKLMKTPRCGLPDKEIGLTSGRRKRYTIHGLKWPYTDLTWSLRTKQFQDLDPYEVRYVISKALAVWSKHSKLSFTEVDSDKADVLIYFYRKSVDVHFDADESWTTSGDSQQGTNLFNVAAHEIGHSLGLSHSNVEGALMYPWYSEMKDGFDYELPDDDKLAIQYLYGSRDLKQWGRIPQYHPQQPQRPSTTSTTTTTTTTTTRPPVRAYPRYPYDPRYPNGRYPYNKPETPYNKPMNPEKKPHYHKPKHEHNPHHKHPFTGRHYPSTSSTPRPETKPTKLIPRKHHTPHKEYPSEEVPPDTCDTTYDAVAVIRRELFIFKDKWFWRIGDNGVVTSGYPAEITRLFRGFPRSLSHVDAVLERSDGNIMFFVDDRYYLFSGVSLMPGYPKTLTELGLSSSVRKIDGAMIWGHNGKTYFFSGDQYWRFDDEELKVEMDYPRNMSRMWKGVGTDIDAVFQWKDGKTYFFKGKGFWKFNDLRMRVDDYEQKLSAPVWMGCKQNFEQNDLNQKLPYTGGCSLTKNSLFTILIVFISRVLLML